MDNTQPNPTECCEHECHVSLLKKREPTNPRVLVAIIGLGLFVLAFVFFMLYTSEQNDHELALEEARNPGPASSAEVRLVAAIGTGFLVLCLGGVMAMLLWAMKAPPKQPRERAPSKWARHN